MDIQNQALIAEIERFKTESLKTHVVKVWADSYENSDPFGYVILKNDNNKVWWMKTQAYQLWEMWQAAKSQKVVVTQWISIGEKLPEYGCRVLVFDGESVDICTYHKACEQYPDAFWFDGFCSEHNKVTHWQRLPEPLTDSEVK